MTLPCPVTPHSRYSYGLRSVGYPNPPNAGLRAQGSEARAAIIFTQEASRAQPMSPAQKRFRAAPRVYPSSPYSPGWRA